MKLRKRLLLIFLLLFVGSVSYSQTTYWQKQNIPDPFMGVKAIAVHPNNIIFVGDSIGSIYSSSDPYRGVIYEELSDTHGELITPLNAKLNGITVYSLTEIFAGFDTMGVYKYWTTDNGETWSREQVLPFINATTIFTDPSGYIFAGTDNGEIYRTSLTGISWELIGSTNYFEITSMVENFNILYCGTMGGGIFKSSDLGNNWVQIVTTEPQIDSVRALHINSYNEIYVATLNNGVYKSSDLGVSWVRINNGIDTLHYNVTSIASGLNNDIFIGTIGGGVYRSTNFGANWNSVKTGLTEFDVYSLAVDMLGYIYAGTSTKVFRTSLSATLDIPTLVAPDNGRDSVSVSPLMVWNGVPVASLYYLKVSKDPNFTTIDFEQDSILGTSLLIRGGYLDFETEYYWQVQASSISGMSNWSEIWKFKTAIASPDIPILLRPVKDTIVSTSVSFLWNASQRATKYYFQLSTNRDFSTLTIEDSEIIDTSYNVMDLALGTKYYWRVRAINISWMSDWSMIDSFSTTSPIPPIPTLLSPKYAEENVGVNNLLSWSKEEYASLYDLQVSTDSLFLRSHFFNDSIFADTIKYIGTMDNNTKYYWRVRSRNISGTNGFSPISYFITIPTDPIAPTLVYPDTNAIDIPPSPTFVWNNSGDRNSYQLHVSDVPSFTYIVNDISWVSDTTQKVFSLQNDKQYYWRVRARNSIGISDWSPIYTFKTYTIKDVPPWWSYASNTGNNSSISIPIHPTIDNVPISNGDAIGVFFSRNDTMICGGYTIWDHNSNNGIIIWGNNAQTTIKDGFAQNEVIQFRIWDAQNSKEYPALVKLAGGKTSYFINEYLTVDSLRAATKIMHTVNLHAGWNLISTYADPHVANMDSVCKDIRNYMVLLKDGLGNFYWPNYDIYQVHNFEFKKGYQIYMLMPATLTFVGSNVLWDSTKIDMIPGWNMISYLRYSPMQVDSALSSILDKVILVKNDAGEFFWNEFGINSMGSMKPGIGYQIYMSDTVTFHYPNSMVPTNMLTKKGFSNLIEPSKPQYFVMKNSSSVNTAILLFESNRLKDKDEVAVFNSQGYLVGSASAVGNRAFMTIFGYDEIEKNVESGAKQNEYLYIKIFDSKTENEYTVGDILVTDMISNKTLDHLYYKTDALLKATEQSVKISLPDKFSLEQNYPNPFNPTTIIKFSLPINSQVSLEIYNTLGQVVKRLINSSELNAGKYQVEFNAEGLSTGIYFYKLQTDSYSETKKMMLLK